MGAYSLTGELNVYLSESFRACYSPNIAHTHTERYIVNCPDGIPKLPVRYGLPPLEFNTSTPYPGGHVELQIEGSPNPLDGNGTKYLVWLNGQGAKFTEVREGSTVSKVPSDLQGIAYAALVSNATGDDIDKYLLSTYVVVDLTFDSYANNSGPSFD